MSKMMQSIEKHHILISIGTMIAVMIFLISFTFKFASWNKSLEMTLEEHDDRITHVWEKIVDLRGITNVLTEKSNEKDIELAKINVKLIDIQSLLLEIKQDIKQIR